MFCCTKIRSKFHRYNPKIGCDVRLKMRGIRCVIQPGSVVSTPFFLGRHVGIVTNQSKGGSPAVISNSGAHGGIVEQSWDEFRGNNPVRVDGYPGKMPVSTVLSRARSKIGTRYSLLIWNCEHFVRYAHGLQQQSPQLALAIVASLILWRISM